MLNRQAPRRQDVFLRWPEMLLRQIRYDLQASDWLPGTRASAKIIRMVREKAKEKWVFVHYLHPQEALFIGFTASAVSSIFSGSGNEIC